MPAYFNSTPFSTTSTWTTPCSPPTTCRGHWTKLLRHSPVRHSDFVLVLGLGLILVLASSLASGQDDFFGNIAVDVAQDSGDSPYSFIARLSQKATYGLESPGPQFSREDRGLAGLEANLWLQLDTAVSDAVDFRVSTKIIHDGIYRARDGFQASAEEINLRRDRVELRDFYLDADLGNGSYLKLGRQLIVWGMSEFLRVNDLVNVEDQLAIAQQDFEDLRLPVPAALFSTRLGNVSPRLSDWRLETVLTYQAGRHQIGPEGDEFDQFINFRAAGSQLIRDKTRNEYEGFLRLSREGSRGDIQFTLAEFNDNGLTGSGLRLDSQNQPVFAFNQNRMRALGMAGNWVADRFLLFGELGLRKDQAVTPTDAVLPLQQGGWAQKDQILAVAGVEYNGFGNSLLSLELNNIHTRDHDRFMREERNQFSIGARAYWTALNDRLTVLGVWNRLANDNGHVARITVEYDWSDRLQFAALWVNYGSERGALVEAYEHNDVFQLELQYSLQF